MFTLLATPPGPPTQKYQKLGSPGPPGAHNLHAGGFRHGEKDFDGPGAVGATKKIKKSIFWIFYIPLYEPKHTCPLFFVLCMLWATHSNLIMFVGG